MSEEKIMKDLVGILKNFEGREFSGKIGPETFFFADLGMASIDAVVLSEKLENYYGQKIPFFLFLTELSKRQARDLRVGELVQFLCKYVKV